MSTMEKTGSGDYDKQVEKEYGKYCRARKQFVALRPNWIVYLISSFLAIGIIVYAVYISREDIVLGLAYISGALIFLIGVVTFEHWRVHRRMEALAEMRLRGKTFNF